MPRPGALRCTGLKAAAAWSGLLEERGHVAPTARTPEVAGGSVVVHPGVPAPLFELVAVDL